MLKRIFLLALAALAGWMVWRWLRQRQDEFGALAPQLSPIAPAGMTPPPYESPSWSVPPPDRMAADVAEEAEAAWHGVEAGPGEAAIATEEPRAPEVARMDELLPESATQQAEPSPQVAEPGELEEGASTSSAAESAQLEHEPSAGPTEPAASAAAAAPESETAEAPSALEQPAAEAHTAPGDRAGEPSSAAAATPAEYTPTALEDTDEAEAHTAPGDRAGEPSSAVAATSTEHSPAAELEDMGEAEVHAAPGDRAGEPSSADAATSAEHMPTALEDTGEAEAHTAPGDRAGEPSSAVAATSTEHSPAAELEDTGEADGIVGYCVRCKTKRAIADAHEETTESGRHAARGTCPVCGANMFTFLPSEE